MSLFLLLLYLVLRYCINYLFSVLSLTHTHARFDPIYCLKVLNKVYFQPLPNVIIKNEQLNSPDAWQEVRKQKPSLPPILPNPRTSEHASFYTS